MLNRTWATLRIADLRLGANSAPGVTFPTQRVGGSAPMGPMQHDASAGQFTSCKFEPSASRTADVAPLTAGAQHIKDTGVTP
jgi:hypothetical protein